MSENYKTIEYITLPPEKTEEGQPEQLAKTYEVADKTWRESPLFNIKIGDIIRWNRKGSNGGSNILDQDGKIEQEYFPSWVNDVLQFNGQEAFPQVGESDKIYIDQISNLLYYWNENNNKYVLISGAGNNQSSIENLLDGSAIGSLRTIRSGIEDSNYTIGSYAMTEGYGTKASGQAAHAEGSDTTASGQSAHAEGSMTTASAVYAHAEGYKTKSSGYTAHSEGNNTIASGFASHVQGYKTQASGHAAHAEGDETKASNDNSHAQGNTTIADGSSSHAEGFHTISRAYASHTQNQYTIAAGESQTVLGKYNKEDQTAYYLTEDIELDTDKDYYIKNSNNTFTKVDLPDETALSTYYEYDSSLSQYAVIIGNGNNNTRSNALAIKWDGNIEIAGTPTENNHLTTKAYVDSIVVGGGVTLEGDFPIEVNGGTISHADSEVTADTYQAASSKGSGYYIPSFTVDSKGHITQASNINSLIPIISTSNVELPGLTTSTLHRAGIRSANSFRDTYRLLAGNTTATYQVTDYYGLTSSYMGIQDVIAMDAITKEPVIIDWSVDYFSSFENKTNQIILTVSIAEPYINNIIIYPTVTYRTSGM